MAPGGHVQETVAGSGLRLRGERGTVQVRVQPTGRDGPADACAPVREPALLEGVGVPLNITQLSL